ncbi:MAG: 3-dehydroquinate synthase [Clostridiales bacterium]|nr:MAG: 3-dehydroquinate synthase [Clostridiales bacterium]
MPETYAEKVARKCGTPVVVTLKHGEESKNFDNFKHILSVMLENSFSRKDCVVAVGGGVVGDIGGFAASCYMRGVDFFITCRQPFLSMVDSSIGGKTAIDFMGVKNVVGSFYQPKAVVVDPCVLSTLDDRQLYAGLAESIKMAATSDASLFEFIENADVKRDVKEIIERSILIKKSRRGKGRKKEEGLRKVLNFGHTVGHAIESAEQGKLLHGECVATGMLYACSDGVKTRLENLMTKFGLPVRTEKTAAQLLPYITHDKKASGGKISTVYVDEIGSFKFIDRTAEEILLISEKKK